MKEKKLTFMERLLGRTLIENTQTKDEAKDSDTDTLINTIALSKQSILSQDYFDLSNLSEKNLYELYDLMDEDSIVSSALDLLADSATPTNPRTGHVVSVESTDKKFENELNDFLWNIVKVDTEAWEYVRTVAKYGKLFLDTKPSNSDGEWAFTEYPESYNIKPLTYGQDKIKYYAVLQSQEDDKKPLGSNPFTARYEETLRQRENKPNSYTVESSDRFISAFNSRKFAGKMHVKTESSISGEEDAEELYIKTGKSILASVVDTWRTLSILENQLTTYRLSKSNVFKIVQIDITGANNKEAQRVVDSIKNTFKSSETLDLSNNPIYKNRQSPIPYQDYVFIPRKGTLGAVTIDQVGGEIGTIDLSDINYFRNKLFAGLGALKAYLGWEESTPGGLGDSTLTRLDERAAKRAKRAQQILRGIIEQLVTYYWKYSKVGRSIYTMPQYNIILAEVSSQEKDEELERLESNINIADGILGIAADERFIDKISEEKLFNFIFGNILNIDVANIDTSITPEDAKVTTIRDLTKLIKESPEKYAKLFKKQLDENVEGSSQKRKHTLDETNIAELAEHYFLQVELEDGTIVPLLESLDKPEFSKTLNEKTYKQLKTLVKTKDPKRLEKSKKLTGKYLGLDDDNYIMFQVTAEDPEKNRKKGQPTSYLTKISLKDLAKYISKSGQEGLKDADLVRSALNGDIAVSCECPASKYWGQQWVGTQQGYSIVKNDIAPTRNLPTQVICKHVTLAITLVPFFWNTIVKDLRAKGLLSGHTKKKDDKEKEEKPTEEKPTEDGRVEQEPKEKETDKQQEQELDDLKQSEEV